MIKKTLLITFLCAPAALHAFEIPLAIASGASLIGGVIVDSIERDKPYHERSNAGQAMQAAGTVGLMTSVAVAAAQQEPVAYAYYDEADLCDFHYDIHPYDRAHYACRNRWCRYYCPPVRYRPARVYRAPRWGWGFGWFW